MRVTASDTFSLFDEDIRRSPWTSYAWLHDNDPVHRVDSDPPVFVVSRFDDVRRVLGDPPTYSSVILPDRKTPFLIGLDDPDHQRIRRILSAAFTPAAIALLEEAISQVVDACTSDLLARRQCDLVAVWSRPIPLLVIGHMFGISTSKRDDMARWSEALIRLTVPTGGAFLAARPAPMWQRLRLLPALARMILSVGPTLSWKVVRTLTSLGATTANAGAPALILTRERLTWAKEVLNYLSFVGSTIARHRRHNQGTILDLLIAAQDDSDLTDVELLLGTLFLLLAGHETTSNLLASAVRILAEDSELLAALRADPEQLNAFVEEALRFAGPVQRVLRRTTRATSLSGVELPADTQVVVLLGAANRDARRFEFPAKLAIDRPENDHLAFGSGRHYCLGAHLARLEARLALNALISSTRSIQLDPMREMRMITDYGAGLFGYRFLPVVVERR